MTPNETEYRFIIQTVTEKDHGQYSGDLTFPQVIELLTKQYESYGDKILHIGITRWRQPSEPNQNQDMRSPEQDRQRENQHSVVPKHGVCVPASA